MATVSNRRAFFFIAWAIGVAFVVSRVINLGAFPIHCDEALYLRWAESGLANPALRWMSLADGKQPMFIWLEMLALPWFADPLIAGRAVAVVAGFVAMCGVATLAAVVFQDRRTALAAAGIYTATPFFVFYDRFAMYESLTVAVVAWGAALAVVFARTKRLDAALGLGLVGAVGCLTKSTTMVLAPIALLSLACFHRPWRDGPGVLKWIGGIALAAVIASAGVMLTYLTPWGGEVAAKNESFMFGLGDFRVDGLLIAAANATRIVSWLANNMTVPVLALACAGVFLLTGRAPWGPRVFLAASCLGPLAYLAVFGKHLHPRYFLVPSMPLLVLAAHAVVAITRAGRPRAVVLAVTAMLAWPMAYSTWLVVAPTSAPLHAEDRRGYLEDWSAGTNVAALRDRLRAEAATSPITVVTEGEFGLFPAALAIGRRPGEKIDLVGMETPVWSAIERRIVPGRRTFVVLWSREAQRRAAAWPVRSVAVWERGPFGPPLTLLIAT